MVFGSNGNTPSLAKIFQDYGQRWVIERVTRSTEWVAVLCEDGRHKFVWAHDLTTFRFNLEAAERGGSEADWAKTDRWGKPAGHQPSGPG